MPNCYYPKELRSTITIQYHIGNKLEQNTPLQSKQATTSFQLQAETDSLPYLCSILNKCMTS